MPPSSVHFNGSVNLPDAETVMREISSRIPTGVRRMTDGETGERGYWILFQIQKFLADARVRIGDRRTGVRDLGGCAADAPAPSRRGRRPRTRSAGPTSATPTRTPSRSRSSTGCRRTGRSRPACASRCSTPPRWPRWRGRSCPRTMPAVAASYETGAVRRPRQGPGEAAARPLRGAVGCRRRVRAPGGGDGARLGDADRAGHARAGPLRGPGARGRPRRPAPLLWRLRPPALQAARVASRCRWTSSTPSSPLRSGRSTGRRSPSPRPETTPTTSRPLRDLTAGPETELYFALVPYHPDDQPDGTTAAQIEHIDTALAASSAGRREWGICTECGMGRVAADDVPRLLDLAPRDPHDLSRPALRATSSSQ